jgi:hypothetical protein
VVEIEGVPRLRTPGVLANELGEPIHRVLYVLRTRKHIQPSARAGRLRLYDQSALSSIRGELDAIDAACIPIDERNARMRGAE